MDKNHFYCYQFSVTQTVSNSSKTREGADPSRIRQPLDVPFRLWSEIKQRLQDFTVAKDVEFEPKSVFS